MSKTILALSLMAFSCLLAGCEPQMIDTLCEARVVRVTPELRQEFRKWLKENGHLRTDAPDGADRFLKDLKINNDLIKEYCRR